MTVRRSIKQKRKVIKMSSRKEVKKVDADAIRKARHKEFDRISDAAEDRVSAVLGLGRIDRNQRNAIPYGVFMELFFELDQDKLKEVVEIVIDCKRKLGEMDEKYNKKLGLI